MIPHTKAAQAALVMISSALMMIPAFLIVVVWPCAFAVMLFMFFSALAAVAAVVGFWTGLRNAFYGRQ